MSDLFHGVGVEVNILQPDNFSMIVETLTRIGIASKKENKLFQSCNILHKRELGNGNSHYSIVHFKEMFKLDGKGSSIDEADLGRRNAICFLLQEWGLLKILNPQAIENNVASISSMKILPFSQKGNWTLVAKYKIGKK